MNANTTNNFWLVYNGTTGNLGSQYSANASDFNGTTITLSNGCVITTNPFATVLPSITATFTASSTGTSTATATQTPTNTPTTTNIAPGGTYRAII